MGRPIQKKFFGNTNYPYDNDSTGGFTGIGGEGVASVTFSNSGTLYSQGTTVSFGQPNIAGGIRATGTPVIDAAGLLRGVTITEAGTGYTSAPTLTVTTASQVTQYVTNSGVSGTNTLSVASVVGIAIGMRIYGGANGGRVESIDPVLNRVTSSLPNDSSWTNANNLKFYDQGSGQVNSVAAKSSKVDAITFTSYLTTGSSAVSGGDIMKQVGSRRYKVRNSEGVGVVKLTTGTNGAGTLSAGQMSVVGTDWGGSTYYFEKINANTGRVFTRTNTSTAVFSDGQLAKWTLGAATGTTVATALISISHTI